MTETKQPESLQELIDSTPSFVDRLFSNRKGSVVRDAVLRQPTQFVSPEFTNWRDEQRAWRETVALYDQSYHMTTTIVRGREALPLFASLGINGFATFGPERARHYVACSPSGHVIGDGVLYATSLEEIALVGRASGHNWLQFQAETEGWDVTLERDEHFSGNAAGRRNVYRYQVEGPNAFALLEKLNGAALPETRIFDIITITIAGHAVSATELSFLRMVAEYIPALRGYAPTEPGRYNGWYPRMHTERASAFERVPYSVDYFTSTRKNEVAFVGEGSPVLGVFVVDTGGEPRVVVAKVVDGSLVWKTTQNAPGGNRVVTTTVMENGQPVTRQLIVGGGAEPTTRETKLSLDGLKVTDIAGKKVRATSLEMRLGDGKGIVLHTGPMAAELRAMFKEDTLFVETGPGGGVMMPGFAPAPVQLDFNGPLPQPVRGGFVVPGGAPAPAPDLPRAIPEVLGMHSAIVLQQLCDCGDGAVPLRVRRALGASASRLRRSVPSRRKLFGDGYRQSSAKASGVS